MARIYVSSTFSDLEEYRKEVSLSLRRLGHEDVAMEYYVAEDRRPLDRCLSDVASCDVYIGIFAWRYGHVPQEDNPEGRSITELEYRKAQDERKPCLIFLLSEEASWPKSKQDKGIAAEKIETLRQEILSSERRIVSFFENTDELTRKVNEAVIKWEKDSGLAGKRQLTDWDAYRQAVCNKHQWVRLQVIAGASKERGIAKIPLTEVFEPQLVVVGVPRAEVPEEVLEYQKVIYGPRRPASDETVQVKTEEPETTGETVEAEAGGPLFSGNPELVLDMLGREPTQVILGGPGSGKSTILHYAMLRVCQAGTVRDTLPVHLQTAPIPFLIELRNYVLQKVPDFVSYIVQNSKGYYDTTVEAESVVNVLEQKGKTLVFFDGLDEVFDPDDRRRVLDQFQTFAHRYPQTRIVVTSRIAGYDRTALGTAGFEHYTLLPLNLGQIRHFVSQWYQYYTLEGTERTAQSLVQRIIESPRLLDLAGNPLLLTMMAVIYKDRDLPNERWRLYQRCAETLLEDWELGKGIEIEDFKLAVLVRTAQKSEILQRVSMYMLEHSQSGRELNAIAYVPLLDIVATYLEERYQRSRGEAEAIAVDILRHLMEHTYVLAGIGERVFGFVHRTFMEYFAACRCQAQFNARKSDFAWLTRDIFGAHWQGGEWEEVLLLLIAMLHDQETPIHEVVEYLRSECRTTVPFNVAFAARCLGEAGDVQDAAHAQDLLAELARAIAEYAPQFRKEENRTFVASALRAFAALAPLVAAPAAVQEAIDRLNQAGNVAARMAAWQMGFALRSRKERMGYALTALHDNEAAVRRGAIAALESEWPGRADIGPALADVVRNDPQTRVRQAVLAAMQRSWRYEPAVLDAISGRVDEETSYTYVVRLIEYLAKTWRGNPKALDLVVRLAGPKPKARYDYDYAGVARAAVAALVQGWGGNAEALAFLQGRATSDLEPQTRAAVFQAIAQGWGGNAEALAFLQGRATSDLEPQTRAAVFQAIAQGWGGNAEALAFLQGRATSDLEPQTRAAVFQAIAQGWGGNAEALAFLQGRATSDLEPQTRAAVFQALESVIFHSVWEWSFFQDERYQQTMLAFLCDRAVHDPDAVIRESLIQSFLPLLTEHRSMFRFVFVSSNVLDTLRDRAMNDPEVRIRVIALAVIAEAADRLQWFGAGPDATQAAFLRENLAFLREQATKNAEADIRSVALWTTADGCRGDTQALAFLQDRTTNALEAETRLAGAQAIGWSWGDDAQALAFLQERATSDPEAENRSAIRRVIEGLSRGERMKYWPLSPWIGFV